MSQLALAHPSILQIKRKKKGKTIFKIKEKKKEKKRNNDLANFPSHNIRVQKNNKDEMLVKPEWLEVRKTEMIEIIVDGVDLLEEVRKLKVKDNKVVKAIKEMK